MSVSEERVPAWQEKQENLKVKSVAFDLKLRLD